MPLTAGHLSLAAFLALGIAGAARAVRALSWSGMAAAAFVGFCLFGFAGSGGAIALLLFFVTSSALSRIGKAQKAALLYEKGGERDAGQVLANGGVAALCALFLLRFPGEHWPIVAMLGSLAAANADTWATEIGSLAKSRPIRITDFRPATTGESGAISGPGTVAAFAGAALIALVAFAWNLRPFDVGVITLAGFSGSLFDSLAGATVQAQYRERTTERLTERRVADDGTPNELVRGIAFINNDIVNLLATLFGAVSATLAFLIQRTPVM